MDFRKVTEPLPTRRRSFRPLELSIYLPSGRLSPLPDFCDSEWEDKLAQLQRPSPAVLRRETLDNSELPGDFTVPRKPLSVSSTHNLRREVTSEPFFLLDNGPGPILQHDSAEYERVPSDLATIDEDRSPTLVPSQLEEEIRASSRPWSSRSSILSSPLRMRSPSPFTQGRSRPRANSENPNRTGSFRRSKNDTVDEAIRELNTIVEERRVKALLGARNDNDSVPPSPTTHVPAIAPSMKVRARSETLSDIGSAFSMSVASKPMPPVPSPSVASTAVRSPPLPAPRLTIPSSIPSSITSSSTALPQMPLGSHPVKMSTKLRLSTWLKRSLPGSPASPNAPQPFYQLTPPITSQGYPSRSSNRSYSVSTLSSVSSLSTPTSSAFPDSAYVTPTTTVAGSVVSPTTPADDMPLPQPRPSISKTPKNLRRVQPLKRGLSIDTTLSNGSALTSGPPAYQEDDPHPPSVDSPITPNRVGMAI